MITAQKPSQNGTPPSLADGVGTSAEASKVRRRTSVGEEKLARIQQAVGSELLIWDEDLPPQENYGRLGIRLAKCSDLFGRPGFREGLLLLTPDRKPFPITKGSDLAPVVVDRVPIVVVRDGKPRGGRFATAHLDTMLHSEKFLAPFRPIDRITAVPLYLPDFRLTEPGYNDGGPGHRILYVGDPPVASDSLKLITDFLDVMAFESNADRSNAVAAILTVLFHNHWLGGKPIIVVTATKSHAGKDTVILFATSLFRHTAISYQATNWALERSFVGAVHHDQDVAVVVIENARLDRSDRCIASAFLERFATDPEPLLFSTGTGGPIRRKNDIVLAISTNFGTVSEDIMNRSLPIHLDPVGNVADRKSPIGNPKLEYLPNRAKGIFDEVLGMVERWKAAGMPLDDDARHPFSLWAKTIGGILKANGFRDFLGNYGQRRTLDDPLRESLGILGVEWARDAAEADWERPDVWAQRIVALGLTKKLIPQGDQDSPAGRCRGTGVVLSAHRDETFTVETDDAKIRLRLERRRKHSDDGKVHNCYRFVVVERMPVVLPED